MIAEVEVDDAALEHAGGTARPPGAPPRDGCARRSGTAPPGGARRSTAAPRSPSRAPCRARSGRTWRAGSAPACARTRRAPARRRAGAVRRPAPRGAAPSSTGAPCGTTRILSAGHAPTSVEQPLRRVGHHDHALGLIAERGEHLELVRATAPTAPCAASRRAAGPAPAAKDSTYSPSGPPKIPYSCWRRTTSMSSPAEQPRRAHVVAANGLRDGRQQLGALRARRLVDDDDRLHVIDGRHGEQRGAHVEGERADAAGTRRVRREDRGTHVAHAPFGR